MLPMLSINEIKIGMRVRTYQLGNIKGVYFLIDNTKRVKDHNSMMCDTEGTIVFMGKEQNDEYNKVFESHPKVAVLIN